MARYIQPFQKIEHLWNLENTQNPQPKELEWNSWSLKQQKGGCDELTISLAKPEEMVDPSEETGLQMTIGDEVGLYAYPGGYAPEDSKRFGGYINRIEMGLGETAEINITALDYSYALKLIQIFKDYHKILPIPLGQYSNYISKFLTRNTLYECIKDITPIVGFNDFSELQNPYHTLLTGTPPLTRTSGSVATCTVDNSLGQPSPSFLFNTNAGGDSEAKWTIYSGTGYDLADYPHLVMHYYAPTTTIGYYYYFEVTVNGVVYTIPWFGVPTSSDKTIPRAVAQYTTTFTPMGINIYEGILGLANRGASLVNTVTNITLVAKKPGANLPANTKFWMDNIGIVDMTQVVTPKQEYTYKDALTVLTELARSTGNEFRVDPYKRPIIIDDARKLTDFSIIEGENLVGANIGFSDDEFFNNVIVLGNLEEDRVILGHAVAPQSILDHLQHMLVEENSEIKTQDEISKYAQKTAEEKSGLIPTIKCTIKPNYNIYPGMIIPVYIPSLGLQRSLEILTITHNSDFSCEVELGNPPTDMVKYLSNMAKHQKIGLTRGVSTAQNLIDGQSVGRFNKPFIRPKAKVVLTGKEMISPHVDLVNDRDDWSNLLWSSFLDESQIRINYVNTEASEFIEFGYPLVCNEWYKFPFGIDTRNIQNAGLQYLSFEIFSGYNLDVGAHYMTVDIYGDYDPLNPGTPLKTINQRISGCERTYTGTNQIKEYNVANGCEDGTTFGWDEAWVTGNGSYIDADSDNAYGGKYALKYHIEDYANEELKTDYLQILGNQTVCLSGYVKGDVASLTKFHLECYDINLALCNSPSNTAKTVTDSYGRIYHSQYLPANTIFCKIVIEGSENGTVWIDQLQIETGSTPTTWGLPVFSYGTYKTYVVLNSETELPPLDYYHIVVKFMWDGNKAYMDGRNNDLRLRKITAVYGAKNDVTNITG